MDKTKQQCKAARIFHPIEREQPTWKEFHAHPPSSLRSQAQGHEAPTEKDEYQICGGIAQ